MHPFVLGHLRFNRAQAVVSAVGIAFEVMSLLLQARISRNLDPVFYGVHIVSGITVYIILWFVLIVSTLFVAIGRFHQIKERTQQFAILKMLGASSGYIFDLLCQETLLVVVPGAVLGTLLAWIGQTLLASALPETLFFRSAYEWLPLSFLIAALSFLLPAIFAVWVTTRGDLVKSMECEE